ncbi:MAG: NAD(P)H-dependent glycerol-3-phosphate dehydrogenase [Actinobacteria bacterium]|nr:NAD(P)H-dependent glycerol-3-phosphate dehydrogenase [Actinomycetota bacterium]
MGSKAGSGFIMDKDTLAVIGAGCWGTTLAALEAHNFSRVNIFTREANVCEEILRFHTNESYLDDFTIPCNVVPTTSLEHALDGASIVIVAVPSHAVREVTRRIGSISAERLPTVLATKGLEENTGLVSLEVWRQEAGYTARRDPRDAMVLSGPNLAREISRGLPAVSVLAGQEQGLVWGTVRKLSQPLFSLVGYHDPLGAQASGALKNVYAIGCGLAKGLGWGDNVTAAIIWRGLEETAFFAEAIGGDPAVIMTPAGLGDFVATCISPLSRNHDLGRIIAGAGGVNEEIRGIREGFQTAREASRRGRSLGLELDLLEAIWSVVSGEDQPEAILEAACGASDGTRGQAVARGRAGRAEHPSAHRGYWPEMGVAAG